MKLRTEEKPYLVLLYYCYTKIEDPLEFRVQHNELCIKLGLRGRIIVAKEGLNGTVSGPEESCERYMETVKNDPRFAGIDFKAEAHEGHAFRKLNVRVKPEIVHSGFPHIDPTVRTGTHLSPEEFREMKDDDDVVIVDMRSDYEHKVGRFKDAVTLDINHFREVPTKIDELKKYKNKKVITYCTGGIKCEKASAYLLEQGFEDVYQLHGGIVKYGMEAGGEDFDGKCYVFDNRVTTEVNTVNPKVVSTCYICGTDCDRMVNCANPHCNRHTAICESCADEYEGTCSVECKSNPDRRKYDGTGSYKRKSNGYDPRMNIKQKHENIKF